MNIIDKMPPIKIEAYIQQAQAKVNAKGSESKASNVDMKEDKVELSQTVKDMNWARNQIKSVPDIREEKVEEIKNQINAGTYKIDGKKVAFNMVRESLIDEMV